jgi:hypothetical protein
MNQLSCSLTVFVHAAGPPQNVIVGDSVPVVSPYSLIRNCGSNGVGSGISVALRHGLQEGSTKSPELTTFSGTVDELLSQYSSRGSGRIAATNRANNEVIPSVESISSSTSGTSVRASTINSASRPGNSAALITVIPCITPMRTARSTTATTPAAVAVSAAVLAATTEASTKNADAAPAAVPTNAAGTSEPSAAAVPTAIPSDIAFPSVRAVRSNCSLFSSQ